MHGEDEFMKMVRIFLFDTLSYNLRGFFGAFFPSQHDDHSFEIVIDFYQLFKSMGDHLKRFCVKRIKYDVIFFLVFGKFILEFSVPINIDRCTISSPRNKEKKNKIQNTKKPIKIKNDHKINRGDRIKKLKQNNTYQCCPCEESWDHLVISIIL